MVLIKHIRLGAQYLDPIRTGFQTLCEYRHRSLMIRIGSFGRPRLDWRFKKPCINGFKIVVLLDLFTKVLFSSIYFHIKNLFTFFVKPWRLISHPGNQNYVDDDFTQENDVEVTSPGLRSAAQRQTACGCLRSTGASVCRTGERSWRICENCNRQIN